MDTIKLDQSLAKKFDQGMASGETIQLPFPVVYLWTVNGGANYKPQAAQLPALYYGGWAGKAEDFQTIAAEQGLTVPPGWAKSTISTKDGDEFEGYSARSVVVAPIGKRDSWLLNGKRNPHYVDGARHHVQVLCYMATGSPRIPWGPVVLSAKGYQARNLENAFSAWSKATASARSRIAPGVPAWLFYLAIGTFGKERTAVNVGKAGAQSPITPIYSYIPDDLTDETVAGLFVGHEQFAIMSDLQDKAAEWLGAWKQPEKNGGEAVEYAENGNYEAPVTEDFPF